MLTALIIAQICAVQAAATCTSASPSCPAVEAPSSQTGGAALLQLAGAVGKRAPDSADDKEAAAGAKQSENKEGLAALQRSNATASKKPKTDDFDFGSNDNNDIDTLSAGNNNNADLTVNNVDTSNLNMNNNVNNADLNANIENFDIGNTEDKKPEIAVDSTKDGFRGGKGKEGKGAKAAPKPEVEEGTSTDGFNFNNNAESADANAADTSANTGNDFDFGEGPIKSDDEKAKAATESLRKKVNEAVEKISSALKDAETNEQAVHDAIEKLDTDSKEEFKKLAATVSERVSEAEAKVKEAQKELQDLHTEMESAAVPVCPRVWLLVGAGLLRLLY